ncbi:hypothetical protein [Piscinibacter koreensis]|uniref:Uncharacterized protein n=1 Tax=Piscinibacter koreensis TaxID=2742824 RepID=A0A7Y6NLG1_9BURK|nr:hypothetical protein [Schlegelella koreensis]NUZ05264.1 hypothetical protein [Schlegelella koreensis]
MSLVNSFFDGSLLGSERLMRAREFYAPERTPPSPQVAFERWTQRLVVQSELGTARELAGLSDAELEALQSEFIRCPTRPRSAYVRGGIWAGVALVALGCLSAGLSQANIGNDGATGFFEVAAIGLLIAGLVAFGWSLVASFSASHLDLSYGTLGLYVGELDEQHPWLYKAVNLVRLEPAAGYRRRVLAERGRLRGVDYVLMRELVKAHDQLEQTRPARLVAEQLQTLGTPGGPPLDSATPEPRLVQVGAGGARS